MTGTAGPPRSPTSECELVTFVDALGILGRRWYLVILGVAITAVLATLAGYRLDGEDLVPRFAPEYETSAVVNVTANDPAAPAAGDAPRIAYSLQAIVESGSFGRRIGGEVPGWAGGSIKASVPNQTSIMELLVAGPSARAAEEAMRHVLAALPAAAGSLVTPPAAAPTPPAPSPFTIAVAGTPTPAGEQPSSKGPVALALMALLGLAATWSLTLSFDRARMSRWARRATEVHDLRETVEPEPSRSHRVPELAGDGVRG